MKDTTEEDFDIEDSFMNSTKKIRNLRLISTRVESLENVICVVKVGSLDPMQEQGVFVENISTNHVK